MRDRTIHRGRIIEVVRRRAALPNGRTAQLDVVRHPGAAAVVPMISRTEVLLLRQYRGSVGEWLYEIVAGTLNRGEAPRRCAARELIEETGSRASRLRKLLTFYTAPGFCTELMHLYVATGLRPARAHPDPDEVIEVVRVPLSRALRMIFDGRIRDAKSIAGLLAVANR